MGRIAAAVLCMVACAAALADTSSEWNEQAVYVTRMGPSEPGVQEAEPAVEQPQTPAPALEQAVVTTAPPARTETRTPAPTTALESGIIPALRSERGKDAREGRTAALQDGRADAARSGAGIDPAIVTPARPKGRTGAASGKNNFIDKFIDRNDDGYNDKTHSQDL